MRKYIFLLVIQMSSLQLYVRAQEKNTELQCIDCHQKLMTHENVHPPADEACDYCHESNGNEHPSENTIGFKLTDAMPDLCFTCHEGYDKKNIHPPAEEGECMMCHSPHSSGNSFLLIQNPVSKLCFECHDEEVVSASKRHQPVEKGDCNQCHDPHQSDSKKFLKSEIPTLCFSCHEKPKEAFNQKNLHPPFEEDCRNCHGVHGAKGRHLLDEQVPALCFDCHENFIEEADSSSTIHQATQIKKKCLNCHSPHASNEFGLLVNQERDLCLGCHNKSRNKELKTLVNMKQLLRKSKYIHGALEDGCITCHNPHLANNPMLLTELFPQGTYAEATPESFALCFNCHDEEMLTAERTKSATGFRNGDRNLHYLHIKGSKGRSCVDCHNVHATSNEHMIAESVKFGNWDMPIEYKVFDNGGSCLTGCHKERKYDRTHFSDKN